MTENKPHNNSVGQDTLAPTTTKYHSGFVSGLQVLLWPYREQIEIDPEKWLSKEGIRMDILLLKKDPEQLDPEEYAMLRVLTPGARAEDIRRFKEIALQRDEAEYRHSVDNIFQVSISANREMYNQLRKEDPDMCEAMRELMKDEFDAAIAMGEARGEARGEALGEVRGEIKGFIRLYSEEMGLTSAEIIARIMHRFNLEEAAAANYVEETLGRHPA